MPPPMMRAKGSRSAIKNFVSNRFIVPPPRGTAEDHQRPERAESRRCERAGYSGPCVASVERPLCSRHGSARRARYRAPREERRPKNRPIFCGAVSVSCGAPERERPGQDRPRAEVRRPAPALACVDVRAVLALSFFAFKPRQAVDRSRCCNPHAEPCPSCDFDFLIEVEGDNHPGLWVYVEGLQHVACCRLR